ncbi:MAG: hypothetical protein JJU12_06450 [Chlamydiales bacterium]|nr:hypothetical protein [Chlamydiales bacterium]
MKSDLLYLSNPPSKLNIYGLAIGIIGLVGVAVGLAGSLGAICNLNQVQAGIILATGAILFMIGVSKAIYQNQLKR